VSSTAPRAAKARAVLDRCRHAHQKMGSKPTVPDWVLIWVDTIALLRAVGHVLERDAESDARLKQAHRAWLNTRKKPNPPIFWDFIQNALLKEAELAVEHSVTITLPPSEGTIPRHAPQPPPPPPIHNYKMKSGRFAGQDPCDLVRNAIEWWEKQLDDIEQKAARPPLP
jgi:hypothetical protein